MALAEARAAWQRTANRCLVQEDAKRAPKLACCSSLPSSLKHTETLPSTAADTQDSPTSNSMPFYPTPSHSNLSPTTKWWLQMQPNYRCQRGLMDENPGCLQDDNKKMCQNQESSHVASSGDDFELVSHCKGIEVKEERLGSIYHHQNWQDPLEDMVELRDICIVSRESSKSCGDVYFDSEASWIGTEKNTPWWRTADTEELAFLVAQRSFDLIENCDLPSPQNVHVKNNLTFNTRSSRSEISTSLPVRKPKIGINHHSVTHDNSPATSAGSSYRNNLRMTTEEQLISSPRHPLRLGDKAGKAQLLEALRHSQTRAREAETVAKQACAEKQHVVKLVLRQAQQLFAYKQWLQLLQLENTYFRLKNNKLLPQGAGSPQRNRKMHKGGMKSSRRNRARRSRPCPHPRYNVGEYAIVIALSLGLVGAGLLLGWTIGWMLPMW